jgi:hypothetical protein
VPDPISDGTMACPVPNPDNGDPCIKKIPQGWTADEGHGGGHMWMSPKTEAIFAGGHYDASAALAGVPFEGHLPEDCYPGCPHAALRAAPAERTPNA